MFATFAELLGVRLPDLRTGAKGAEDSISVLSAWRGGMIPNRPMLLNDHKESKDHAAGAIRLDAPIVNGVRYGVFLNQGPPVGSSQAPAMFVEMGITLAVTATQRELSRGA